MEKGGELSFPWDVACAKAPRWKGTWSVQEADRAVGLELRRCAGGVDSSLTTWERADHGRELHMCAKSKEKPLGDRSKG